MSIPEEPKLPKLPQITPQRPKPQITYSPAIPPNDGARLDKNWNHTPQPNRKDRRLTVRVDPSTVYTNVNKAIITRRRHDGRICLICGYRLGHFAAIAGITPFLLSRFLHRSSHPLAQTVQMIADTINVIKGDMLVGIDWCIKYLRHDVSDVPQNELDGTFEFQTHNYSQKLMELEQSTRVRAMTYVIRKHVQKRKHRELGIVPASIINTVQDVEQLQREISQAMVDIETQDAAEHLNRLQENKVRVLAPLLTPRRKDTDYDDGLHDPQGLGVPTTWQEKQKEWKDKGVERTGLGVGLGIGGGAGGGRKEEE